MPHGSGNFGPQVLARAQEKKMGRILALKAMAKGPMERGADRSKYPKCWYEPLATTGGYQDGTEVHPVASCHRSCYSR